MALNRPPFIHPSSPSDDQDTWRLEMERKRQMDLLRQQIPPFGSGSQPAMHDMRQVVEQMVEAEIRRFNAARKAMNATIEGLSKQVLELRTLYDYIYRYHPEVIGEFDVVQRAKERIK